MRPLHIGYNAVSKPVRLLPDDRKTHMHIIGSSGSGKSKFMEWMLRGELRNRQGFCLLDPHGTLYDAVADYCAHHVLKRDIILLNLSKPDSIIGFNPFRKAQNADLSVQVDRRIAATLHAWNVGTADQTPTLERVLRLVYTVMLEHNLGLPQASHLIDFNAHEIRRPLIDKLSTPLIQKEWRELQQLKAKDWRDEVLSAKNRLFRFLTSQSLTRFMGLPERSIDLLEIMEQGKILLVNLAPSDFLSHENARVFGSLLINEFFECARRRKKQRNGADPKPYYLYMDEFQNFVSLDVAGMLDQVRKFGLFLILAHQRFGHLDENLIDAVLTNCKIKTVFGGLPYESAERMARELFIGGLDPKKVKAAIYQTKFWPTYARDKVYTHATSRGDAYGSGSSSASGSVSGMSASESFMPNDWFSGAVQVGLSSGTSSGYSESSGSSSMHVESYGETEGEADIPIFIPVPFQELSSVQYYTIEEQLVEVTAALKEQYGRHCFIKIHNQDTQPMLVPFVKDYYTKEVNKEWYKGQQLTKNNALPAGEVDDLLEVQERALINAVESSETETAGEVIQPAGSTFKKTKSNVFKTIDPIGRE